MKATTLPGHNNPIYTVIAHPYKAFFYSAGNDKGIVEWDLNTKAHQRIFKVDHTVYALEIIPESDLLIAGSNDGTIYFFDLNSSNLIKKLHVESAIFHIHYMEHKKEILAATDSGNILILSPEKQEIIHQFPSGSQKVRSFAIHQNLNLLVTVSNDEWIRIYNLDDYAFIHQFKGHETE
jgi:WD40 repeat protein